jgi:hypothetical protein
MAGLHVSGRYPGYAAARDAIGILTRSGTDLVTVAEMLARLRPPIADWGLSEMTVYERPTPTTAAATIAPARLPTKPATKSTPHNTSINPSFDRNVLVARAQPPQHAQHLGQLTRQTSKVVFDSIEPAGLLALVVFNAIEPAAVQVQGLLELRRFGWPGGAVAR